MPDVVASRQNQQNAQKQPIKAEITDTNGEEGTFGSCVYRLLYVNVCSCGVNTE